MPAVEFGSYSNLYTDGNKVAYWKLENTTEDGGVYTLTNNNSVTFTSAQFNNGGNLGTSNVNKSLTTGNNLGISGGPITIMGWMAVTTSPGTGVLYNCASQFNASSYVSYDIWYQNNGGTLRLGFNRGKSGVSDSTVWYNIDLGTNTFFHLALTYDNTNVEGCVNGVSIGTVAASGTGTGGTPDNFALGSAYNGNSYASVIWDDVVVFSRGLTESEIYAYYTNGALSHSLLLSDG